MTLNYSARLEKTAFKRDQFPEESIPEIAIAGRSNVGKSSLINAIAGQNIARVASKPGKTRSINFIRIEAEDLQFYIVDLPGYGYAARSKQERNYFASLIEEYLTSRSTLAMIVSLVDFRHGLLDNDLQLQEWMTAIGFPFHVVFTKVDKIARGKRKQLLMKYIRNGLKSLNVPHLTSSETGDGILELKTFFVDHLKNNWQNI